MKEKKIKETNGFNPNVTIGIVGYGDLDTLQEIKYFFSKLSSFTVVYIKTSTGRLWIKEGSND